MVGTTAVVVQSFVKLDTLRAVLQSLARCDGAEKVDLILWHEGLEGSRRQGEFERPWHEVRSFLSACPQSQKDKFRSVEIFSNEKNLGPYITCKKAIDYGFQEHDFVVFF